MMDYKIGGQWKPKFISDQDSRWHTSSKNIKSGVRAMNNGGHWIHRNQGTKPAKTSMDQGELTQEPIRNHYET